MASLGRLLRSRAWLAAIGFAVFAYLFHYVGNDRGWYSAYWSFQIVAHYVSASALALLVARVGLDGGLRGRRFVAFVVFVTAAGALGWELVEYLAIFDHLHFWGIDDSLVDLAADALGLLSVLLLVRVRRIRRVVDPRDDAGWRSIADRGAPD